MVESLSIFQNWVQQEFDLRFTTVAQAMEMLCSHSLAHDETVICSHFEPCKFSDSEIDGFEIYTEEQGVSCYFVANGDENKINPPVYFRSWVDLSTFGGPEDGITVVASDYFVDFIWQAIAQNICLREDVGRSLARGVNGILFEPGITLNSSFRTLPNPTLPDGVCCLYNEDTICEPAIGFASFLSVESKSRFIDQFRPSVTLAWG